nr:MAG TPA: hypothetical protein [Caudoviricetes sp.]
MLYTISFEIGLYHILYICYQYIRPRHFHQRTFAFSVLYSVTLISLSLMIPFR